MKKKTKNKSPKTMKHKKLFLIVGAALTFVGVVGLLYAFTLSTEPSDHKRLVTFYDRGTRQTILTRADSVQDALNAAEIQVDARDTVEPSRDTELTDTYVDVIIYRSRLVKVVDGGIRQNVLTVAQSPNAILRDAKMKHLNRKDKTTLKAINIIHDGAVAMLTVERAKVKQKSHQVVFKPRKDALTVSKGAQVFVDSAGIAHRETYYDLPMSVVIRACGKEGTYKIRSDGAKVDQDGYVLIAANLNSYPRCTVVETSLGPGKVYDTGGFAARHPYGFDLATDWTNYNRQ
jgi:hypothetical protein